MSTNEDRTGGDLREGYAEVGDIRLQYVETGDGPLIVLLRGFPEFWYGWRLQLNPLAAASFRVVAPDLRGSTRPIHGSSRRDCTTRASSAGPGSSSSSTSRSCPKASCTPTTGISSGTFSPAPYQPRTARLQAVGPSEHAGRWRSQLRRPPTRTPTDR
jgi:hypothetical protein